MLDLESGAGLLFQASMLFIGLLAIFILMHFLTTAPFAQVDFEVVFARSKRSSRTPVF